MFWIISEVKFLQGGLYSRSGGTGSSFNFEIASCVNVKTYVFKLKLWSWVVRFSSNTLLYALAS